MRREVVPVDRSDRLFFAAIVIAGFSAAVALWSAWIAQGAYESLAEPHNENLVVKNQTTLGTTVASPTIISSSLDVNSLGGDTSIHGKLAFNNVTTGPNIQ